ncbi:MAG: hypothetical protein IT228_01775 [Flavobacteriales bacterium]|nr:hypothetical protein [Flavobacteriales bacterium]MCC6576044.1 hypothetical protein [Flavobacteriales bacterium]NUQ16243.1 hypothetical protein [Flavobacteriales bacterium]
MKSRDLIYVLACISYCLIIGAGTYEHLSTWRIAFSEPPRSLMMFQGEYAIQPVSFWRPIHPLTLILLLATLALNWRTGRRKNILITLGTYVLMIIATFIYFVPELMSITTTPFADTVDAELQKRAHLWISLSMVRLSFIFASACVLIHGLTKPEGNPA